MALQAKQTTQQRLMLAPNVTMALEILRMPTMELQTFLEQQLQENPLLELDDEGEENGEPAEEPNGHDEERSNGLDEDWVSHWQTVGEQEDTDESDQARERAVDQRLVVPQSLHESLRMQLGCQPVSEEERRLGLSIIHHLNEYGYLEGSLEELAVEVGVRPEQVEAALRLIQRLDPPGVGARDLRECLMIQLEQRNECHSLAYRILDEHYPLFVQHRLGALAKALEVSPEHVAQACETLKRLNPKPGRAFTNDLPASIIPDLVIHHREKHYDVELNDQDLPHVTVSRAYYRMLKDPRTPVDAREFLSQKFRMASWLIKAIDERHATLLSIARCLISLQRGFLDQGQRALKPLTQAQVASLIGRHPSTVSRAIAGKTIDTPYGIMRLDQFFANGVPQEGQSDGVSDERIKSELLRLVTEEDARRPFSDSALATHLAQRNIVVARRTIAKYRTSLKILPAHLRKRRF